MFINCFLQVLHHEVIVAAADSVAEWIAVTQVRRRRFHFLYLRYHLQISHHADAVAAEDFAVGAEEAVFAVAVVAEIEEVSHRADVVVVCFLFCVFVVIAFVQIEAVFVVAAVAIVVASEDAVVVEVGLVDVEEEVS
jgi:hypothetical protein